MDQSEYSYQLHRNCSKRGKESRVQGAIGFGFGSHSLKNVSEIFKPITKRSNRNHVITFDSHLKTSLSVNGFLNRSLTSSFYFPQEQSKKEAANTEAIAGHG